MMRKRRTEIVIEAERTIIYTTRHQARTQWCPSCNAEVEMVTAFEAARLGGVSSYTIYRWAEDGDIHSGVTPEGVLLVCLKSLSG
jgi:hypothetical protein